MLRHVIAIALLCIGCGGIKPITIAPPSWDGLMAWQTIHNRLVAAQEEIRAAHRGKLKTEAQKAFLATEAAWEAYSAQPTVEHWNQVQTVGSTLDAALRNLRGEKIGEPGQLPPCRTGQESWCKQPHTMESIGHL